MFSFLQVCALAGVMIAFGCSESSSTSIDCADLGPVDTSTFTAINRLVSEPGPKSCAACHNAQTPIYGLDFSTSAMAYDAMSSKIELIYAQLSAGKMPQHGQRWSASELQLLRTWYCSGGFYEGN